MRIPPIIELIAPAEIFITDIVTSNPAGNSIDYNNFAMIPKIDLEAVPRALLRVEIYGLNAACPEFLQIRIRQFVTADFIIEKVDLNALAGLED